MERCNERLVKAETSLRLSVHNNTPDNQVNDSCKNGCSILKLRNYSVMWFGSVLPLITGWVQLQLGRSLTCSEQRYQNLRISSRGVANFKQVFLHSEEVRLFSLSAIPPHTGSWWCRKRRLPSVEDNIVLPGSAEGAVETD